MILEEILKSMQIFSNKKSKSLLISIVSQSSKMFYIELTKENLFGKKPLSFWEKLNPSHLYSSIQAFAELPLLMQKIFLIRRKYPIKEVMEVSL